jgi:hypothetical protein
LFQFIATAFVFGWLGAVTAFAHIGDQNVFFEGAAGAYPVRVVVRPPGVIPGLAEISVRVETNGVQRVTVLPMRWDSGRKGAPPPDVAQLVRGETNLYNAQLWFMRGGAQSVEVTVTGAAGDGKVIVPVNAVATRVLNMPSGLGTMLACMGATLVLLAVSIIAAGVRESVLVAGQAPTRRRLWISRGIATTALIGLGAVLFFGKRWWDLEASDYRNNRLYQPAEAAATVQNKDGKQTLTLVRASELGKRNGPLVPEHGKLMHLFLVREPGMDAFAHLHPLRLNYKTFETPLPPLPAGNYRVYADVTYETGFSETLTTNITLAAVAEQGTFKSAEPDDSWKLATAFKGGTETNRQRVALGQNLQLEMNHDAPLIANRDVRLRFQVRDVILRPVSVEHFMGMAGHLIVRRDDGAVFTHLHPSGSYSMSAQQLFELRAEGKAPLTVASSKGDPLCRLPEPDPKQTGMMHSEIAFPYAFPKAGAYRLWMQVKVKGEVLTGVFDVNVRE